jgi:hypothetical protein
MCCIGRQDIETQLYESSLGTVEGAGQVVADAGLFRFVVWRSACNVRPTVDGKRCPAVAGTAG